MSIESQTRDEVPSVNETAAEALDDRTLLDIRAEETAWERAPAGLQDAIEAFDRESEARQ